MTNLNNTKLFAMEVLEGAGSFKILANVSDNNDSLLEYIKSNGDYSLEVLDLPASGWSFKILGTYSKGVADFDVEKYVKNNKQVYFTMYGIDVVDEGYRDYTKTDYPVFGLTATDSFGTLLTAFKLNKEKRYLIIEKI